MKKVVFMLFALCHAVFSFAQHTHLTLEESKEIKEIAMKKVESFQADCKKIADSNIPFHKKTSKDGYIDVTMLDFMEDASIRVTSPDKKTLQKNRSSTIYRDWHCPTVYIKWKTSLCRMSLFQLISLLIHSVERTGKWENSVIIGF